MPRNHPDPGAELRSFARRLSAWLLGHPTGRWVVLGGGVGLLCGLAAAALELGCDLLGSWLLAEFAAAPAIVLGRPGADGAAAALGSPWALLAVLVLGGLAAGLTIQRFASAAKGGGTGVAVDAFHRQRGRIAPSTTLTKLAASILSLGSGGSGGREGPISLMGAGAASWLATRLHLSARDRRTLLVAGIAGGIAAVFRAPLAGALFAVEVLYRGPELEAEAIVPSFISAVVGYLVGTYALDLLGPMLGHHLVMASTLFLPPVTSFRAGDWPQLAGFTLVAAAVALMARWFIAINTAAGRRFDTLSLPFWCRPALGAGLAGLLALGLHLLAALLPGADHRPALALTVIGSGYGALHWLFADGDGAGQRLVLAVLLAAVAAAKAAATAFTVGSGGSAGLFGPAIAIGGCTGGAVGLALHGTPVSPPLAACVLTGMAGMLAATHRTPVAALLMVSEVAGTWLLLMPAMWVCGLAFLLTGRRSLIAAQVDALADSPAHRSHLFTDALAGSRVADLPEVGHPTLSIPAGATLAEARRMCAEAVHEQVPVVRPDGILAGMLDRAELARLAAEPLPAGLVLAEDLASGAATALRRSDPLALALRRLHQQHADALPVVDDHGRFLGLATSSQLMEHYHRAVEQMAAARAADDERSATG